LESVPVVVVVYAPVLRLALTVNVKLLEVPAVLLSVSFWSVFVSVFVVESDALAVELNDPLVKYSPAAPRTTGRGQTISLKAFACSLLTPLPKL
jgi:hypothetical protein